MNGTNWGDIQYGLTHGKGVFAGQDGEAYFLQPDGSLVDLQGQTVRIASAEEPAPKPKASSGPAVGGPGTGGMGMVSPLVAAPTSMPEFVGGTSVMLTIGNSPLWVKEPGVWQEEGFELMSVFLRPERFGEATPKPESYEVGFTPITSRPGGAVLGLLSVHLRETRPPEEIKKVVALAERLLERALIQIHKANVESGLERLRQAEQHLDEARAIAEKRRTEIESLRTQLSRTDASPEGIDQQQTTLRQERLKFRVELVGLQARREAIVKAIEEANVKLKAVADEHQRELGELAKIVELRQQQLARISGLVRQGAAPTTETQQAELEVSRAKADLAERRRVIAQQAGSDQLGRLNQQLADVQIEMSAAEARMAAFDRLLDQLQSKEVLELLSQYGRATQQLEYARAEEKAAFEQVVEAKKMVESTPGPRVAEIRVPAN